MAAAYLQRMGGRIKQRREALGLSRADVARAMPGKTNDNAIYRWEKGAHRPQPDALEALAGVLNVPVSYFLMDAPASGPPPDLMGALSPTDDIASRVNDVASAVAKLLEAQETMAELAREDRALLREVAQAVLQDRQVR